MRKSVEAKQAKQESEHLQTARRHRRIALWLTVPLVAAVFLLFLSYVNQQANEQIRAYNNAVAESQKDIANYRAIAAAKKAEAEAKARIAAEIAAKAETERQLAAAKQTNPQAGAQCGVADPGLITVVINKKHCFSPIDWAPGDIASLDGYPLRQVAATQMQAMMTAAVNAGSGFSLSSAYRSYANQQVTYNNWVQVNGSTATADTVSARPGYSEHQTGLAADLKTEGCVLECFGGTAAYAWLKVHAAEYGFIERYPAGLSDITGYAPESWHWRYIGAAAAMDMKTKGIQTLEQYYGVSGGSY